MARLNKYPARNTSGFTLVEILVVITILAILMTIGITVYSGVQKNARDLRRKSDLRTIKIALELYYQSKGSYPIAASAASYGGGGYKFSTGTQPWIPELTEDYISSGELPKDPFNTGNEPWRKVEPGYKYGYVADPCPPYSAGQYFVLVAQLENKTDVDNIHNKGTKYCDGQTLEFHGWSPSAYAITSL